jgi:hypothetical protein
VFEIPQEIAKYRSEITKVAKDFGVRDIRFLAYSPDNLPYSTAVLHLYSDVPTLINFEDLEDEITQRIGINTIINNRSSIIEEFRDGADLVSNPL